jgi:alpha-amylase/alpha-mannosidase (GH57 family)
MEELVSAFLANVFDDQKMASRVSLRFGMLNDAQEEPDIEERFVRAKVAADGVKGDPRAVIGIYEYDSQEAPEDA